jgi:DNA-binding XRE family transcriptional regulator
MVRGEKMLHERIKKEREKKNISQSKLGKIIGVSQQTIGSWEVGRTAPAQEMISSLAVFFGVTTDYLYGLTDVRISTAPVDYAKQAKKLLPKVMEAYETMEMNSQEKKAYEYLKNMPKDEAEEELQRLIDKIKDLSHEQRKAIEALIDSLFPSLK